MPFSSDGDTIDFIYGVINWKAAEPGADASVALSQTDRDDEPLSIEAQDEPLSLEARVGPEPLEPIETAEFEEIEAEAAKEEARELIEPVADEPGRFWPIADHDMVEIPEIELGADAGLADRLWAARESAEAVKTAEGRSRDALYQALSYAYDFALASKAEPEDFVELLDESGVKAQARAPMTPIVKLVFGIDYDKARLTEYAAALSYAERQQVELGGFLGFIEVQAGGLKALVAAERQARRPGTAADTKTERARQQLRQVAPMPLSEIHMDDEFALVLTRRSADGAYQPVAVVDDPALVEKAIRKAADC